MGPYVAVSGGQAIWICDIHSGTSLIGPLEGHRSPIRSLAFSPDGRTLASGSNDETIRLWDTKTGQTVVEPLTGHTHAVNCVRFSLDGRYVVSGSEDWTLCIWDAHTGGAVGEPIDAGFIPWALALIPGGKLAVGGVRSSDITVYDTGTLGALFECAGHEGPVKSISCSPDGRVFASGSNDCTVRIWDSASGRPIYGPLEGHEAWVASVDFSPDSKYIASGSWDGTLRIWDVSSGTMCGEPLVGPKRGVREVAFTLDGNCLISAGMDGHIRVWDVRSLGIAAEALKDQATAEMRVLGTELASANSFNQIVSQLDDQDGSTDMMNPLKTTTESVADITSASVRRCSPRMYPATPEEIVLRLGLRGCPNMTDQLDLTTCSGHPILSGGFGDIYQARLNDGAQVAIKTIRLYIGSTEQNQKLLKHAAHEIYAWSKCKHPNVQPLLGLVMFRGRIGMIAHWESKGDLSQYLKRYADTDRCVMVRLDSL
ncbi:hypothetical protein FRC09_006712 [Ceratobasidium sp. 395]|nr:hypothetical protein FRC09_006712 [Ceratobasidium sp. 395]